MFLIHICFCLCVCSSLLCVGCSPIWVSFFSPNSFFFAFSPTKNSTSVIVVNLMDSFCFLSFSLKNYFLCFRLFCECMPLCVWECIRVQSFICICFFYFAFFCFCVHLDDRFLRTKCISKNSLICCLFYSLCVSSLIWLGFALNLLFAFFNK